MGSLKPISTGISFLAIGFADHNTPVVIDWESVMFGPIGTDLLALTDGMPPLPWLPHVTEWYVAACNARSFAPIFVSDIEHWLAILRKRYFLVSETIDALRFAFCPQSPVPEEQRMKIRNRYLETLTKWSEVVD